MVSGSEPPSSNRPHRASRWWTSRRELALGDRPLLMGILNATPDSFSDGGRYRDVDEIVAEGVAMQRDGADILDVGGESTRPGSEPVDASEERRRTEEVVRRLAKEVTIPISIDTSKSSVAAAAMDAGAEVINDVTGLTGDPAMIRTAVHSGAGVCAMHMRGTPKTMQDNLRYDDLVGEIRQYLIDRRDALLLGGIADEKICLDPGIGFGKSHAQNRQLMGSAGQFVSLGSPILVGHSRKGFIGKMVGDDLDRRDAGTLGGTLALAAAGVQIIRVHEVRRTAAALRVFTDAFQSH